MHITCPCECSWAAVLGVFMCTFVRTCEHVRGLCRQVRTYILASVSKCADVCYDVIIVVVFS